MDLSAVHLASIDIGRVELELLSIITVGRLIMRIARCISIQQIDESCNILATIDVVGSDRPLHDIWAATKSISPSLAERMCRRGHQPLDIVLYIFTSCGSQHQ